MSKRNQYSDKWSKISTKQTSLKIKPLLQHGFAYYKKTNNIDVRQ